LPTEDVLGTRYERIKRSHLFTAYCATKEDRESWGKSGTMAVIKSCTLACSAHQRKRIVGGCYVETAFTLDIGTKLDMVSWLGEPKIVATGVVVTRHSQVGNGIKFTGMSVEVRNMLRRCRILLRLLTPHQA
jgi:hypothetical protein